MAVSFIGGENQSTCRKSSMPTGFFIWGYMYPLPSFLGVHQNFWGCNVPSNSSFGGTKKMNCIFSTQGRAFCILRVIDTGLSLLYRIGENLDCPSCTELAKTFFFCLTLGQTGTGVLCAFVSVLPFFCNIVYNLSHFVFIQNWMQDYL